MRKKAMERLRETRKRQVNEEEEVVELKRSRRGSGSETIEFLREETNAENAIRMRKLEIKRERQEREQGWTICGKSLWHSRCKSLYLSAN